MLCTQALSPSRWPPGSSHPSQPHRGRAPARWAAKLGELPAGRLVPRHWVQIPILPLTSCTSSSKRLNL